VLCEKVRATFEENFGVYGTRKVWWKLAREEEPVARCKAESWCACWVYKARSRRGGATRKDDVQRKRQHLSAGSGHPPVSRGATKIAMAHGLYLSGNMGSLYIKDRTPSLKPVQPSFRSAFQKNS